MIHEPQQIVLLLFFVNIQVNVVPVRIFAFEVPHVFFASSVPQFAFITSENTKSAGSAGIDTPEVLPITRGMDLVSVMRQNIINLSVGSAALNI